MEKAVLRFIREWVLLPLIHVAPDNKGYFMRMIKRWNYELHEKLYRRPHLTVLE